MPKLQLARFAVTFHGRVPLFAFAKHFPAPVQELAEQITTQIRNYADTQALGYFPAIEFFRDNPGSVDPYLLDAFDQVASVAQSLARQEVETVLQPVFSSVKVISTVCLSYSLPRIRPGDSDAELQLGHHYTPNWVKLELALSLFQKQQPTEALASGVKKMVLRWLSDVFEELEVTRSSLTK